MACAEIFCREAICRLCLYGAQNETYNDGKDVKWWNALSAKELRV